MYKPVSGMVIIEIDHATARLPSLATEVSRIVQKKGDYVK